MMRKTILKLIPAIILLIISVVFIIVAIVVFTEKKNSQSLIKATTLTEISGTVELEADGMKLYCESTKKDTKNNFIIKANGSIRINPTDFTIIAIKNGDKLSVRLENGSDMVLLDYKKDGSYYKYNIKDYKDNGYMFVIENQSQDEINIGYIKYWK